MPLPKRQSIHPPWRWVQVIKAISAAAENLGTNDEERVQAAIKRSIDDQYSAGSSDVPADAWQVKYLYDGDCSMCKALVSLLKRQDAGRGLIQFVNIASMNYNTDDNEGELRKGKIA